MSESLSQKVVKSGLLTLVAESLPVKDEVSLRRGSGAKTTRVAEEGVEE